MKQLSLLFVVLLLAGCTPKIADIMSEDNIGKKFTVAGKVENSIKLGPLSGYQLTDDTGTIGVQSDSLPAEGDKVAVTGVLIKDSIFGYYISSDR